MSELLAHLAIHIAERLKDPILEDLIRNHKSNGFNGYNLSKCPIDENKHQALFDKFCRKVSFAAPPLKEALFPLNDFSADEIKAFMWILANRKINSEFRPVSPLSSALNLVISDQNNMHLQQYYANPVITPVTSIERRKGILEQEDKAKILKVTPLYIPPFNVLNTDKGFYILLDHMSAQNTDLLGRALQSRQVEFTEKDSDTCGYVYVVQHKNVLALAEMKEQARTQENLDRAPNKTELHNIPKGCPTFNILEGRGELFIPLEGMRPSQITVLESRLSTQVGLAHQKKDEPDFGPVLSFEKTEDNHARLIVYSSWIRNESKQNNPKKSITSVTTHVSDLPNDLSPT